MNRTEVFLALIPILADKILGGNTEQITLGALIVEDLGADSLDNVEVLMEAEDHFNIEITDAVAEKIRTVEDLVDAVFKLTPGEAAPEPTPTSTVPFIQADVKAYIWMQQEHGA